MSSLDDKRTLERQRFFHGQRLLAGDLNEVVADHRWRRELHNRSLHQAGIGKGFAVVGKRGDREVTIGPGYALDALGREIIATRERVEPVPPVAGDPDGSPANYDLTVSYPAAEDLEESETREGVCLPRGVVRLAEDPVFCWVRLEEDATGELHPAEPRLAAEIEAGLKLRLARIEVEQCRLKSLSVAERRNARPVVAPHIACGHAQPAWRVEAIPQPGLFIAGGPGGFFSAEAAARMAIGGGPPSFFLLADIETASAGFRVPPCYSAGLRGPRLLRFPHLDPAVTELLEIFADGIVSIEEPTPTGFRLRVLPVLMLDSDTAATLDLSGIEVPWTVAWMGVEP